LHLINSKLDHEWKRIKTADCLEIQLPLCLQFLTFRDGKIGVNFAGYHAEAGLGGLLTGNAAHGGLSASAGTPFGKYYHCIKSME